MVKYIHTKTCSGCKGDEPMKFWQDLCHFWNTNIKKPWNRFMEKDSTQRALVYLKNAGFVLKLTGKWAYQLRSIMLAIPVGVCACALAIRNIALLPSSVHIYLLADPKYQWIVPQGVAVLLPLCITAICLMLMFCSKKVLYPWLISLLSLVLPLMIWLSNAFPG